jgi:hypothetical protein
VDEGGPQTPTRALQAVVSGERFQHAVLVLILANAALIGAGTSSALMTAYGPWLVALNWPFYTSFIVVAVFIVINLFNAVVSNNLEAAKRDEGAVPGWAPGGPVARLSRIRGELDDLERELRGASDRA